LKLHLLGIVNINIDDYMDKKCPSHAKEPDMTPWKIKSTGNFVTIFKDRSVFEKIVFHVVCILARGAGLPWNTRADQQLAT
jgi:hypothetical protein